MSEQDVKIPDEMADKEIVLELDKEDKEGKDSNEPATEGNKNDIKTEEVKPSLKFVDKKRVVELTDDEKALIIANAKNGIDKQNFSVKFFKNGKHRIVKKKEQTPTVSQKAIKTTPPVSEEKKVYYSDNQLLFEHIIALNAKVDKLMAKHKKLKRKYQTFNIND